MARTRSGTKWSEADYEAAGYDKQLKVRMRKGFNARLRALAEEDGYSVASLVMTWIQMEEDERAKLKGHKVTSVRVAPAGKPAKRAQQSRPRRSQP